MRVDKSKINMELVNELQKYILKNKSVINIAVCEYISRRPSVFLLNEDWNDKKAELKIFSDRIKEWSLSNIGGHCIGGYNGMSLAIISKYVENCGYYECLERILLEFKSELPELLSLGESGKSDYRVINDKESKKLWNNDWDKLIYFDIKYWLYDHWFKIFNYIKSKRKKI
jgi:hypothetical protein